MRRRTTALILAPIFALALAQHATQPRATEAPAAPAAAQTAEPAATPALLASPRPAEAEEVPIFCAEPLVRGRVKEEVKARLHDPGSLRNWDITVFPIHGEECLYRAQGNFTATNAFGGRVRVYFIGDVVAEDIKGNYNVHIRNLVVD